MLSHSEIRTVHSVDMFLPISKVSTEAKHKHCQALKSCNISESSNTLNALLIDKFYICKDKHFCLGK